MVYIDIDEKEFLKLKDAAKKIAKANLGEDYDGTLTFCDSEMDLGEEEAKIEEINDKDGTINCVLRNKLGYFSIDIKLDDDDLMGIMQLIQKRMNRFKSAIESLK